MNINQSKAQPHHHEDEIAINGISLAGRANHVARMGLHALMKNSGVLSSAELAEWLDGANITRHPDQFDGFEILYGFDKHAQDFIVVKNQNLDGPHFAVIANQGT
ncbi:MAG: hypothetical protein H7232_12135 [Aeromicrobium sp.]|nr:hypothetical protein [Burkholderiales bacterium]